MGVGLEMVPLIKGFIAKLIFLINLADEIALLKSSTSIFADRKRILVIFYNNLQLKLSGYKMKMW